jgi:hypothetical protein
VINGYALVFGVLIVTGGRLAVLGFAVSVGFIRGPKRSPAHRAVPGGHHRVRV